MSITTAHLNLVYTNLVPLCLDYVLAPSLMNCAIDCLQDMSCNAVYFNKGRHRCHLSPYIFLPSSSKLTPLVGLRCYRLRRENMDPVLSMACCPPPRVVGAEDVALSTNGAKYKCKKGMVTSGTLKTSTCLNTASWTAVDITCTDVSNCTMKSAVKRVYYSGHQSTTIGGKTCQRWDSDTPHQKEKWYTRDEHYSDTTGSGPETRQEAANYCRDPGSVDGFGYLWCYTTDPHTRWERCDVPIC